MANLFVYGTLKKGFSRHHYLASARFVGVATMRGVLYDLREYPGAMLSDEGEVRGELYELNNAAFGKLDIVEGIDQNNPDQGQFVRRLTEVQLTDKSVMRAWVYLLSTKPANARVIDDGNFH